MIGLWERFAADPLGFARRTLYKLTVGKWRYARGDGYDAERYWRDRFARLGPTLKAAGHEALSEAENARMYEQAGHLVREACAREGIEPDRARVLEIGCGPGFYAGLCHELGIRQYAGIDITDALFDDLRRRFPTYTFRKLDVTREPIRDTYDLVLMIDVLEHIVEEKGLDFALDNARGAVAPGGAFMCALPVAEAQHGRLFYLRFWSLDDIVRRLPGWTIRSGQPFRDGQLLVARAPASTTGE